jgi:hypothetical protein
VLADALRTERKKRACRANDAVHTSQSFIQTMTMVDVATGWTDAFHY